MNPLRSLFGPIREALRRTGYDIVRAPSDRWLRNAGIETVIDIGANTGQFARLARSIFPSAMIYSFEPIHECYLQLEAGFRKDSRFRAFPVALGNANERVEFHASRYSPSSSVLTMAEVHKANFPYTVDATIRQIEMRRLDDIVESLKVVDPLLVKIDVQGLEDQVINGGLAVIGRARILIVEVSFEPLYVDQALFGEVYELLKSVGFAYHGNWSQLVSPLDGRPLQADAVFLKVV